ncbi:MAG: retroviral-like aspartic protease family protein [Elainella sp. C42_A2020_010]|nr:retroviral-like aspartic protease family protein [Elainella sp. C42_A2020_010]
MPKPYQSSVALIGLASLLVSTSACSNSPELSSELSLPSPTAPAVQPDPATPAKASTSKIDPFRLAIDRASSAYTISKSAQSRDDWKLVANRWRQAIELMKSVPAASPHHAQVRQKLADYQKNLAYAQQQANRPTAPNPTGVIILPPRAPQKQPTAVSAPIAAAVPQVATPAPVSSNRVFYAPIVRREGNTPVLRVLFNNEQPFDMIVDTGASGTLITRKMADSLGVVPIAQATVDTASQKGVAFPVGYVQSMEVEGAVARDVLVAVAGPELDIGLLGHDFFGHYDVTIRAHEVEFRERS